MGAVGSPYENAMVESFWARMQVELFHNTRRRRRHSSLQMLTPTEYERLHTHNQAA